MPIQKMARAAALSLALASAAGCGSPDDFPPRPSVADGATGTFLDGSTQATMQAPSISSTPSKACTASVAIQGTTAPGALVTVAGGQLDTTVEAGATGSFCVDVYLTPNETNILRIQAYHEDRGLSPETTIEVEHYTCSGDDIQGPITDDDTAQSKNVALGQPVFSKDEPKSGKRESIVDDAPSTGVTFEGGARNFWAKYGGWVFVKLAKARNIKKVVVKWGGRSGKKFQVVVTDAQDPTTVDGSWTEVASNGNGGSEDTFRLEGTSWATAVGLKLDEDNKKEYWYAPWEWDREKFDIQELQVWDAPGAGDGHTPEPTHTCAAQVGF